MFTVDRKLLTAHFVVSRGLCLMAVAFLAALLALLAPAEALRLRTTSPIVGGVSHLSRRSAFGSAALALLPQVVWAGQEGTKNDKAFQECLSKCVYESTKITKGIAKVEVVSRQDAYLECKPKCAKTKEQLMTGRPKAQ
ncbi:hypothetical protein AB1Y20_012493 [Prymnesium parvum]|uniref:Uncharacterized protein n=1 Tax=Prymnesium parvum TaxID=97485 RepID=A0AB34IJ04_PRYPA